MIKNNLPRNIAIFPLSNAIFFPRTILPLNIFENRYLQLVDDCMKKDRMFGMVQPKNRSNNKTEVYKVGCLGKIINFNETKDKRFVINLSGIIRFKIKEETKNEKLYRKFTVDYSDFIDDLKEKKSEDLNLNKNNLLNKIKLFFEKLNYSIEFKELVKLNFDQLINTVCMISPFSIEEKQKLIETVKLEDKFKVLDEIINFNLLDFQENKTIQ
ncbi:MAG: hypothetical protein FD546_000140 [Pelagibacterales bacterium]|nr:hypothetical protein [Pelagibacterales bacterium]